MMDGRSPATPPQRPAKRLDWSDDSGSDRDLLKAILEGRLDEVLVVSKSSERMSRRLALGFPVEHRPPLTVLRRQEDTAGPSLFPAASCEPPTPMVRTAPGGGAWLVDHDPDDRAEAAALAGILASTNADVWLPAAGTLLPALLVHGYHATGPLWSTTIMPALTGSVARVLERRFSVTQGEIDAYGHQSGDLNPLHFDDDFARSHGFERRIAHGMMFSGWLTRFLGMEFPGPGTIFLRNSVSFFAPVYADATYTVRISTPRQDQERGLIQVVAQLLDEDGRHCTVSYNDVMLKRPGTGA